MKYVWIAFLIVLVGWYGYQEYLRSKDSSPYFQTFREYAFPTASEIENATTALRLYTETEQLHDNFVRDLPYIIDLDPKYDCLNELRKNFPNGFILDWEGGELIWKKK